MIVKLGIAIVVLLALAASVTLNTYLMLDVPEPKITTSGTAAIGGPFTLVATDGETVSDQTYRGKWLLIYFGYTYCPDACPTALNSISLALERLGSQANDLQPLFVTVDPDRDTRETMVKYLTSFDSRIIGLTGTKDQIDSVIKEYRLYVSREKPEHGGDDYLVSHSSYIYLMDPQGRFVNVIHAEELGDEIAIRLRKEMADAGR
jgi:protein SCO1/2